MSAVKGLESINGKAFMVAEYKGSDDEEVLYEHYKAAAVVHCQLLGVNPDDMVQTPHPSLAKAKISISRWKLHVHNLREFDLQYIALAATRESRLDQPATNDEDHGDAHT